MVTLARLLLLASTGLLGVFAGAMLTEGAVLVPYWRSLAPGEFFAWYAANDRRLLGFFGPVTTATAVATLAAALLMAWTGHPSRWTAAAACTLTLASVAMFFVYFEAANASFSAASVPPGELAAELARWSRWHLARTVLSIVSLGLMLQALVPKA